MTNTSLPYFFYSFGILFREGLETILVIVALAAGARQAGDRAQVRGVYAGAATALGISLIVAWIVGHLLSDNAGDTLEGSFQLFAAATLFYVSSWLTAKTQSERWNEFIEGRAAKSHRSRLPWMALALTAFVAVMREGGETIIFFQALIAGTTAQAETHAIAAGVAGAGATLVAMFFVLRSAMLTIPLRPFFQVTSTLLYLMAVIFVGSGIASWQEAGLVSATSVNHVPTIGALGLFPTIETLTAQAALGLIAIAAIFRSRFRNRISSAPSEARVPSLPPRHAA